MRAIGQRLSWTGSRRVAFVCPGCDRLIIPGASKHSRSSGAPADGVCQECHRPLAAGRSEATVGSAIPRTAVEFMLALAITIVIAAVAALAGVPGRTVIGATALAIFGYLAVRQPEWFYDVGKVEGWRRVALKGLLGVVYIATGILVAWYAWHRGQSAQL